MLSASRAADDLSEQRKSAFKASEIVVIKLLIDRNDSRKRNISLYNAAAALRNRGKRMGEADNRLPESRHIPPVRKTS